MGFGCSDGVAHVFLLVLLQGYHNSQLSGPGEVEVRSSSWQRHVVRSTVAWCGMRSNVDTPL